MKVMLVITGLGMGGAERVVCSLADGLVERGHSVTLVYLTGRAVVLPRQQSVRIINLAVMRSSDFIKAIWRLSKVTRQVMPDIVHGHMFHAVMLTRLVRLICRIPRLVSTVHNTADAEGRGRLWCYRASNSLCDAFTAVSSGAVDSFVRRGAVKKRGMQAIHNGISVEQFAKSPHASGVIRHEFCLDETQTMVLAVGRLVPEKDYPNLLRAISSTPGLKAIRLLIAGEGPQNECLQDLANELGIADQVIFLGIRRDIAELMSASNVFVLSSRSEGYGLVVAEAMACECVVVATDSGGVREVVGDAGFVVPPCDPVALGRMMAHAIALPVEDVTALGEKARSRVVEHYSLDAMVDAWLAVYVS